LKNILTWTLIELRNMDAAHGLGAIPRMLTCAQSHRPHVVHDGDLTFPMAHDTADCRLIISESEKKTFWGRAARRHLFWSTAKGRKDRLASCIAKKMSSRDQRRTLTTCLQDQRGYLAGDIGR
jgi:hypothetical protein